MRQPNRILIEACVGNVEDAVTAARLGADRLEFCSALEVGGLTPDFRELQSLRKVVAIPIVIMVRPRAGGFHYTSGQWRRMIEDAERGLKLGADGVVFGALSLNRRIDVERSATMVRVVQTHSRAQVIFHKAFEAAAELIDAWKSLSSLQIDRVLMSANAAIDLASEAQAGFHRPAVLVGGGIRAGNVADVLGRTGAREIHSSCRPSGIWGSPMDADAFAALVDAVREVEKTPLTS